MRRRREKPKIIKIDSSKKESTSNNQSVKESIDGIAIEELTKKFGSPLFVFSEKAIKEKYLKAYEAFNSKYPNVEFGWSYKTNYLKAICAIFHKLGSCAEVVSEFEYEKARNLGVKGEDIIFNGPYKPYSILKKAVKERAKIHIDNFDEIELLEKIAIELNIEIPVAIRLNMNTETIFSKWDRFGFNIESKEAIKAVEKIKNSKKLILNGLHAHIGTFMLDTNAYKVEIEKMLTLAKEIEENFNFTIEYIDIGGGFASMNGLKGVNEPPEKIVPSIEAYADIITSTLKTNKANLNNSTSLKLYLEIGRHLIDEAGFLITSVVGSREMPDNKNGYILDAGINLLYTNSWYEPKIELSQIVEGVPTPSILNGPLCMNADVIKEDILLPKLPINTQFVISPVGAYNVTQWMQFIQYRPKVVLILENSEVEVIRDSEDLEYMELKEKLPKSLEL